MNLFEATLLGAVQGLGEFLPISSSAHLILTPWLLKFADPGLGFDVALHWGTLLAVLMYFWQDVWLLARGFWHSLWPSTRDLTSNIYQKLSWLLVLSSVPAAIVGKLLEDYAERTLRHPLLVASTLAGFGLVMLLSDRLGKKERNLDRVTWIDALAIGLSQALAIVPGVSRSGSTVAAALALGLKRADAARFSFLMSIPIIFGAGLVKVREFGAGTSWPLLAAGFLASAVFGFLSIKYLLRYLARHDFSVFVWYRVLLAALIFGVWFGRMP